MHDEICGSHDAALERLLADGCRWEPYIDWLREHAPGARICEVGSGTGLLACIAARLGAREVFAVEPSGLASRAQRLVRENGLEAVVEVIEGDIGAVAPREVDRVFSAGFGREPWSEAWLAAMDAARGWLTPKGRIAPEKVAVWVALLPPTERVRQARAAEARLRRWGAAFDLRVGALDGVLTGTVHRIARPVEPVSSPLLALELEVGSKARPVDMMLSFSLAAPTVVGGAMVWFNADLGGGVRYTNEPGQAGRVVQLACRWGRSYPVEQGASFAVRVCTTPAGLSVEAA
jgi:hypothetical protein